MCQDSGGWETELPDDLADTQEAVVSQETTDDHVSDGSDQVGSADAEGGEDVSDEVPAETVSPQLQGQIEHRVWRAGILESDDREEGPGTFTTEKAITDASGEVVRVDGHYAMPDFVDYEKNVVVEYKPIHEGETEEDVAVRYQDQYDRDRAVYKAATGEWPDVYQVCYKAD
jgi:hypothetical protein